MDSAQASNLLFVPLKVSMDNSAACIMVCFIIMDESKLPSYIVPLACHDVSWLLAVMLQLLRTVL